MALHPKLSAFVLLVLFATPGSNVYAANTKAAPAAKRPAPVNLTAAYNAYLNKLRGSVLDKWNPPDGKNSVSLAAVIAPDGSLSDITLSSSPKNEAAEQAANAAFSQAQPLPALPANSPSAKVVLTFQSSFDPHGDSSTDLRARLDPINLAKPQASAAAK